MEYIENEIIDRLNGLYPAGLPAEMDELVKEYKKAAKKEQEAFKQYMDGAYDEVGLSYFETTNILQKNTELALKKIRTLL